MQYICLLGHRLVYQADISTNYFVNDTELASRLLLRNADICVFMLLLNENADANYAVFLFIRNIRVC